MKHKLHLKLILAIFLTIVTQQFNLFAQSGAVDPTFNIGTGFNNIVKAMVTQPDGKIICAGFFTSYNGATANCIIRLNPDGSRDLTFNNGGSGANQGINKVVLQSDGKILIGGHFYLYNGVSRVNIARLNADGSLDASFNAGAGPGGGLGYVNTLKLQTDGKIVVGGQFNDFSGNMYVRNIMRLNSNGAFDTSFGNVSVPVGFDAAVLDLVIDFFGKITAVGNFSYYKNGSTNYPATKIARINSTGTFDATFSGGTGFTGGSPDNIQISAGVVYVGGNFWIYNGNNVSGLIKLNSDGSLITSFSSVGSSNLAVRAVCFLSNGKIIVGGDFVTYNGITRGRIALLNSNGSVDASFNPGTGFDVGVYSLALQTDGKIIVGGNFTNYNLNSKNRIVRMEFCNAPLERIQTVSACNTYTWYGTSYTTSTTTPTHLIPGVGTCDSLIKLNLTIHNLSTGIDTHTACNSYTWINGITYTASTNTPTFVLQNAAGCDSIVTLHLTIQSNTGIDTHTACNSYTWINGVTYTTSTNTPTFVLQNAAGCDSTVTLHLTITHSNSGTDIQTACDSYTWINGNTYTTSTNTPMAVLQNATGCDSTVTLNLTINHPNTGTDIQTACDSYTWIDGNTYTSSTNTPTVVLQNAAGCDSTVTLNLTITHSTTGTDVQTVCNSYTWIDGNTYTTSTNVPTFVLQNVAGCDSTVILHLTIQSNSGTDLQTACDSYTWIDGNTYFSSTNTPTFVLQNAAGCDSTVTLNLTITHSNTGTDIQTSCDSYTWLDGNTYFSSTNTPTFVLQNAAGCDSTVTLNLTITHSNTGTDVQTSCDSYTWIDGNTYFSSTNTPTFVLQNAAGCDSTVTLNLTILNSTTGTDVQTSCDSYTWIDGNTYFSSTNTPTFVLQNAAGCDSTVTLNLTITHSNTGTDVQTSCDSYTWIDGNTYFSSTNTPTFVLQNAAGCDSTVTLNLIITNSTTGTDVQTSCDSYTWIDGNTYFSSTNTPIFVLQNAAGCDSTVTLNLTITHSNTGTDIQTSCDSYTWIDGNTYFSSTNTPTFVLQNAAGCDSTVTLNLIITNSTAGTDIQTACDSYTWIDGNTYTSSTNTPTFVLQNAAGCDSTVTLNLTITNSTTGTDIQTACDSYTWIDGNTYTSSTNTPTFILQNAPGCDSTVTLNLTITNSTTGTDVQTACSSYTWIDGNTYFSSTNTPTFVLQNAAGCDSTVTLNLTITNSTTGTDVQTVCNSYTWIDGNTYFSSTNTPTFVLQNAAGCDSIVVLNLTIIPSLPLVVENVFVFPSDANSCVGEAAIDISGNADFELDFDNGSQIVTSNGYSLVTNLCPGVHDLHVTDNCGDTLSIPVVIPVDSNFVFNNPFIDSLALDSLGITTTNCDIFYAGIDTAYIDSIWATGNAVNVIWNIVDSNGSNFDTTSYVLNNGNGVYWVQLSVFCPNKSVGEYFTVTEAIYFNNGHVGTAGLPDYVSDLFEIYPNPTNDQVQITFSGTDAELTVYDLQGKVVLKDQIHNNGIVSLQNFERGVYLFDFKNSQGHSLQRVIKQ
jgi:uncharacterized delta-60 repeat protein